MNPRLQPVPRQTASLAVGSAEDKHDAVRGIRRHPSTLLALAVLSTVCGMKAGPCSAQKKNPQPIHVKVNMVLVDATVRNRDGQILSGLKKDDFILREDGDEQRVDFFGQDQLPLSVVLVLDISTSIQPFFGTLQHAAATSLAALKPDDAVGLLTFATTAHLDVPLTGDKRRIAREFGSLDARGATNICDGLFEAANYLLTVEPNSRRVIILISDDVGTVPGQHQKQDIEDEILEADASLYNLKIPGDNGGYQGPVFLGPEDVGQIAKQTGGEMLEVVSNKTLAATFDALIQQIKTRYTLGYYSSADSAQNREHKLDVRLTPSFGSRGEDYEVEARRGFYFAPKMRVDGGHSRSRSAGGTYPEGYQRDSWAGTVTATDDATRVITLEFAMGGNIDTFNGILRKGFKVKMSDATTRELRPSMIPRGKWITVFYVERTKQIAGKTTTVNEIFKVNFLN